MIDNIVHLQHLEWYIWKQRIANKTLIPPPQPPDCSKFSYFNISSKLFINFEVEIVGSNPSLYGFGLIINCNYYLIFSQIQKKFQWLIFKRNFSEIIVTRLKCLTSLEQTKSVYKSSYFVMADESVSGFSCYSIKKFHKKVVAILILDKLAKIEPVVDEERSKLIIKLEQLEVSCNIGHVQF